jgi:hypothetical protein
VDGVRTHELQFERTHPSGAQEWFCPTCGRRLLMQWPPSYEKQVLEAGDERASHTGGKIGALPRLLRAGERPLSDWEDSPSVGDFETDDALSLDALRPWLKWVREAGLDDLWNEAA